MRTGYLGITKGYPSASQQRAMQRLAAPPNFNLLYSQSNSRRLRGVFVPYCVLDQPGEGRATRFVFPTLAVTSQVRQEGYLWDVPSRQLIRTIKLDVDHPQVTLPLSMRYVEVSERHVFLCTKEHVLVYSREETGRLAFVFPPENEDGDESTELKVTFVPASKEMQARSEQGESRELQPLDLAYGPDKGCFVKQKFQGGETPFSSFYFDLRTDIATVHVSPNGRNFVATTERGIVFYVQDFEDSIIRVSERRNDERHQIIEDSVPRPLKCFTLDCGFPVIYIAFGYGRIAVASVRTKSHY